MQLQGYSEATEANRMEAVRRLEHIVDYGVCPSCSGHLMMDMARGLRPALEEMASLSRYFGWTPPVRTMVKSRSQLDVFDGKLDGTLSLRCFDCGQYWFLEYRKVDFYGRYPSLREERRWAIRVWEGASGNLTWYFPWPKLTEAEYAELVEWGWEWDGAQRA